MPIKTQETTKEELVAIQVPVLFTGSVIAHQTIMDTTEQMLEEAGFSIVSETYRSSMNGGIAQCIYRLNDNKVITWTNSYLQGQRFECGSGIYIAGDLYMIADTPLPLNRKVDKITRVENTISNVVNNISNTVNEALSNLKIMKEVELSTVQQGQMLGVLYATNKVLSSSQANMIAKDIKETLTQSKFYALLAKALKESHPKTWISDHRDVYNYVTEGLITDELVPKPDPDFTISNNSLIGKGDLDEVTEEEIEVVDPNQTNLIDQIQEVENETELEELELPGTSYVESGEELLDEEETESTSEYEMKSTESDYNLKTEEDDNDFSLSLDDEDEDDLEVIDDL